MKSASSRSRARRAIALASCAAAALLLPAGAARAQTYSVDVHSNLHGLDIKVEPVATSGMLVVRLTNSTDREVRCNLRYDAAPQPIYRKATYVDPGKTEQSVFRAQRKWTAVDVEVDCDFVDKK